MQITYVQQKHPNGCLVAAVAMILGRTYEDLHDEVRPQIGVWKGGKCVAGEFDFAKEGWNMSDAYQVLCEAGFAIHSRYKFTWLGAAEREEWPPKPWAPVHLCEVITSMPHAVVMLSDGAVLDPNRPPGTFPGNLDYYSRVISVTGCWKVR